MSAVLSTIDLVTVSAIAAIACSRKLSAHDAITAYLKEIGGLENKETRHHFYGILEPKVVERIKQAQQAEIDRAIAELDQLRRNQEMQKRAEQANEHICPVND